MELRKEVMAITSALAEIAASEELAHETLCYLAKILEKRMEELMSKP